MRGSYAEELVALKGGEVSALNLACWNTEWHAPTSPKGMRLKAELLRVRPDIVCLPEARHDFLADAYYGIHSDPDSGYPLKSSRSKATLWSRWPWDDVDALGSSNLPAGRFVSGTTLTPLGPIRVAGICIPWRHAHVSNGKRNRAVWEDHERYLEALPKVLERESQRGPFLLLGDFNQRIPARWVPAKLAGMLQAALQECEVWTAGSVRGLDAQLVCHIAGSRQLRRTGALRGLPRQIDGLEVSDHDGVFARVTVA